MAISLDKPEGFALFLQRYVNMDFDEHAQASLRALEFSSSYRKKSELSDLHMSLFE